ncbi:MAG: 1-deoxy-D-xylulose-5-phosphate synthase [Planctomycetes bacterium]|nr:1-deoxy-D-xylulose-5-phosphate synthase [Planctomycetota bacterium]
MILEQLTRSSDVKSLRHHELAELCNEIRRKILATVTTNGGHLGSSMGVVELTVALHRVYDFPRDRLFLDTGHQCYPHKLLTGRFDRFHTLRQKNGISGFPNKDESEYDLMTSGHAGTAVSMALGACIGDALASDTRKTIAVVGDASVVSGMSLEALNSAGHLDRDLLIILNDNEQSIGRTVGALSRVLSKVRMSKLYASARHAVEKLEELVAKIPRIGERVEKGVHDFAEHLRHVIAPGKILDALGFRYFGVFDGHDLPGMVEVLEAMRAQPGVKLLHVLTVKGKGVKGCEEDPLALHGAKPGDSFTLECDAACKVDKVEIPAAAGSTAPPKKAAPAKTEFARVFSEAILAEAATDPRICAITAGMPDGTGLRPFSERFPDRFFNVGIAEQHGVAFASGLTIGGRKPVCAIYSTFMQRGYDQVFQEVALQRNPVILVMSHGGLAGDDGQTHHGLFDIAFLRAIPGVTLLSPRDGAELEAMFRFALHHDGPIAIRYPKAATTAPGRPIAAIELGRAEVLREGDDVALIGYGPMSEMALEAATLLDAAGVSSTVVNARFARPLDGEFYRGMLASHRFAATIEEAALNGGFGSAVLEFAAREDSGARIRCLGVPDRFIAHGTRPELLAELGLTPTGVRDTILGLMRETADVRIAAG